MISRFDCGPSPLLSLRLSLTSPLLLLFLSSPHLLKPRSYTSLSIKPFSAHIATSQLIQVTNPTLSFSARFDGADMSANRYKYFRWTARTAWISIAYAVVFPSLIGYIAYTTDVCQRSSFLSLDFFPPQNPLSAKSEKKGKRKQE